MSKKDRNVFREGFMKNFSEFRIERYILIDDESMSEEAKDNFVKSINEKLWLAIQETNAVAENRILPFVVVRRVIREKEKLRIIINDIESKKTLNDYEETEELTTEQLSHLINFKSSTPQRRIMVGNEYIHGDAKMIIDYKDQIAAAVDIFLDVAMFNSISYLDEFDTPRRKKFNAEKIEFLKSLEANSYYLVDTISLPEYLSFSFYVRDSSDSLDYVKYVYDWDKFLSSNYRTYKNINPSPMEQLQYHIDNENLPSKYFDANYWKTKDKGDYLLLRINSEPNTNEQKDILKAYFGIEKFGVGETKVVPICEYFNPYIKRHLRELILSAFKIVV